LTIIELTFVACWFLVINYVLAICGATINLWHVRAGEITLIYQPRGGMGGSRKFACHGYRAGVVLMVVFYTQNCTEYTSNYGMYIFAKSHKRNLLGFFFLCIAN